MSSSESENSASEVDDSEVEIHSQSSESDQSDQSDSVSEEDDFDDEPKKKKAKTAAPAKKAAAPKATAPKAAATSKAAKPTAVSKAEPKARKTPVKSAKATPAAASVTSTKSSIAAMPKTTTTSTMSKPAATAAAPAVKVLSETDAKTVLLNYINDQNRPYSVIQLHDNLHGSIPRTRLQQLLDRFVADDTIKCKVFGKSQIYFAVQGDEPLPQDELDTMDEQIETMTATLNQKRAENKTLSAVVSQLENSLTNEEADAKIAALEQQVQSAKTRLEAFKQGNVQVDQKQLAALYNEFKSLLKHAKDRKRACIDLCEMAIEDTKKTRKQFFSEHGIETDEEVNFDISEFQTYFDTKVKPKLDKLSASAPKKFKF